MSEQLQAIATILSLVNPAICAAIVSQLELADYAADEGNPLSAFRLQVNEAVFVEDDQIHRYRFAMPGAFAAPVAEPNHPELVLTFIPEPSTLLLALLALGVVGGWRKRGG